MIQNFSEINYLRMSTKGVQNKFLEENIMEIAWYF